MLGTSEASAGKRDSVEVNQKVQVSVVQVSCPLRSTAPGTFTIIMLVRHLSVGL